MKLYEISDQMKELKYFEEIEEIDEQALADTLEGLQLAFEDKAEAITKLLKNISAPVQAIDEEIRRLQSRKKTIEKNIDRLKNYLKTNMEDVGMDVIKTDLITIRLQKAAPSVNIIDREIIPKDFTKAKIIVDIDKNKIKEALKKGEQVPGAELKQSKYIKFY